LAIRVQVLIRLAVVYGVAGLISGWWYVRNARLYGDPLGLAAFRAEFMTQKFEAGRIDAWVSALATLHESFWARFGWMNVYAPAWAVWVYTALEVVAFVGIIHRLLQWKDYGQLATRIWPVILLPVLAFAWLVSFAFTAGLVAWQGRLLFPALPAVAIILACGLVAIVQWQQRSIQPEATRQVETPNRVAILGLPPEQRAAWSIACAGYVVLAGIALWIPFGIIKPAYPFQTIPEAEALSQIATPVYARYAARADERGAALRSVAVLGNIRASETIQVQMIWNALGRQNRDWWVFMHLVDDHENILSEDNRQARDGAFPMTQWSAGDWIESKHPLILPADIQPGIYRLRIGLWFPETERRAGYFDAGEKLLGDYLEIPLTVTK
jgi:hypothetical protein